MPLQPGEKLGPYEVVAPLGAGGMGEVYRAKDTRLGRDVALKILPQRLSTHPEMRERFEREARAISSLNHARICTLHDVGQQGGVDFLVMEYLEGETLADRLKRGALPLRETLKIGIEVCDALETAHRVGIIHRDLKPGNIMLTKSGAKLMDFGLAKSLAAIGSPGGEAVSFSTARTISGANPASPLTTAGTVLGTIQYMSPEQIEGKPADARSDVFAMGAVLYEMTTGKRAFEGKSQLSVASAILEKQPEALSKLQPLTPATLEHVVSSCLEKSPEERYQSAHDVRLELKWIAEKSAQLTTDNKGREGTPKWVAWAAGGAALLLLGLVLAAAWLARGRETGPMRVMRFSIGLPAADALGGTWYWYPSLAVSEDGSEIAYVAHRVGSSEIYLRGIGDANPRPVPGTEGADMPFFSPDRHWLGFYSGDSLKKVPLQGGAPVAVAKTPFKGGCWGPDDTIYYGTETGLDKVAAAGGPAQKVTALDRKAKETAHLYPELLPGGKALVFTVRTMEQPSYDEADIAVVNLANGERKILIKGGTNPHYVSSGHLVFVRAGVLLAAPFDAEKLEVRGAAVPVAENILENPRIGAGQYTVSKNGMLLYIAGGVTYGEHELVFVDKAGNAKPLTANKRPYEDFTISPDGRYIATTIEGPVTNTWIHDIARDTETRFNFGIENRDPTWTPDGKHIAYSGYYDGKYAVFWKSLDGSTPDEPLILRDDKNVDAWFFTPDGGTLLYAEYLSGNEQNIGALPLHDREHARLIFPPEFNVEWAILSPDGKWIAYDSSESGKPEVYVAPYPTIAPRERISTNGGLHPLWSRDGRELYYRTGVSTEGMEQRALAQKTLVMAVPIETKPALKAGQPRKLFEGPYFESGHDIAVTPDGKGFILIREIETQTGPREMQVVLNWTEELRQKAK